MQIRSRLRTWILVAWACALSFGLTYQLGEVAALHASCRAACKTACGADNCATYIQVGCTCHFLCKSGDAGAAQCGA